MTEKDELIEELSKITRQLNQGDAVNPARFKPGDMQIVVSTDCMTIADKDALVEIIAAWDYKYQTRKKDELVRRKVEIEMKLRPMLRSHES